MIDFGCKKFGIEDIIKCSLGLSRADYKLFSFLLYQQDDLTTQEIAATLGLDRTTVQKSIKNLVTKNVVIRLQENLEKGGYLFKYRIKDKEILKRNILTILSSWTSNAEEEIRRW